MPNLVNTCPVIFLKIYSASISDCNSLYIVFQLTLCDGLITYALAYFYGLNLFEATWS